MIPFALQLIIGCVIIFLLRNLTNHVLFLRAHLEIAQQYYRLKKKLAAKYHSDRGSYTKAKTLFIESVIAKATKHRLNRSIED